MQLRVLIGFSSAANHQLEDTAGAVIKGLTANAAYPTLPVTLVSVQAALTAFTAAIAAQEQGGTAATADKNNKREALIALLRQLAGYVQQNCGNDLAKLLSSGFEAVSTNRSQTALATPGILSIDNGNTGQLLIKVTPIANAKAYEARCAAVVGGKPDAWQSGGLYTNSRSMALNGLTPGTAYQVQVRAIGGATGYSDWSDSVSHMSL